MIVYFLYKGYFLSKKKLFPSFRFLGIVLKSGGGGGVVFFKERKVQDLDGFF